MYGQTLFPKLIDRVCDRVLDQSNHIDRLSHQCELAGVQCRDSRQVVQHSRQASHIGLHALQEFALHLAENTRRLRQQQIDITHNRGHGRTQFLNHA